MSHRQVLQLFVSSSDAGRGLAESPEADLDHDLNRRPRERTSTRRQLPITPRKKCVTHTPRPAQGPGPHPDHVPARVLGPDPGPDASQEDARTISAPLPPPLLIRRYVRWTREKICLF